MYSHACARVHMRAHVRLLARSLAQVRAHSKGTLGLAAHTHARLCRHCVIALHHKGAHDAAAAPALPAHHRQLWEDATAPCHDTAHLDQVAQVPGAAQVAGRAGSVCGGVSRGWGWGGKLEDTVLYHCISLPSTCAATQSPTQPTHYLLACPPYAPPHLTRTTHPSCPPYM